jgi:hypothetical protein
MRFYIIEKCLVSIGHLERKIVSENVSLVMVPNNMGDSLAMVPERKINVKMLVWLWCQTIWEKVWQWCQTMWENA